jgi:ankyrin repeat protein
MRQYAGYTMLIFAVTNGYIDIVKFLVDVGADVNEPSNVIIFIK